MMTTQALTKIKAEFNNRLSGFIEDGYCCRYNFESNFLLKSRLKHMSNGNEIVLEADLIQGNLTQRTNHVTTFSMSFK